jgi:hypothetical protein
MVSPMKMQRQADGSFKATECDGAWYVIMLQRREQDVPHGGICSSTLGRVDKDGLRLSARYHAMRGLWFSVEIWQSVPGTWATPDLLLESYLSDGTCIVHNAPTPPARSG